MRKILVSLVTVFVLTVSAQAGYIENTEYVDFAKNSSTQNAHIEFDLPENFENLSLNLSAALTTWGVLVPWDSIYNAPEGGTITANLNYGLNVTINGSTFYNGNNLPLNDQTFNFGAGSYDNRFTTDSKDLAILWLSSNDLTSFLNGGNVLNIDFTLTGPTGYITGTNPPFNGETTVGFGSSAIANAAVTVSYNTDDPVTPEPATMLIFGIAAVAGFPLVRRMRRK